MPTQRLIHTEAIVSWMGKMTPLARQVLTNELNRVTESFNRGRLKREETRQARINARLVLINEVERLKAWR